MNTLASKALLKKLRTNKKKNGFTLIELMVVVAIVGVLSAVGLPQLTKAQDKAKDSTAIATLTNAAKECSLSLITLGDNSDFMNDAGNAIANNRFSEVSFAAENDLSGTTIAGCNLDGALELQTKGTKDSAGFRTARVVFEGGVPGTVEFTTDIGETVS